MEIMRPAAYLKKTGCLGFTLLELTLVMFFMAIIAGLSTPFVMSTLDRMELQASARKVASTLRYARSEAITSKKPVVFSGNLDRNQFWVTQGHNNEPPKITSLTDPIRLGHFITEGEDNFYVGDVVNANIKCGINKMDWKGDVINIGAGDNRSVNDIADLLGGERIHRDPVIEPKVTKANNGKAKFLINWKPTQNFEGWVTNWKKELGI